MSIFSRPEDNLVSVNNSSIDTCERVSVCFDQSFLECDQILLGIEDFFLTFKLSLIMTGIVFVNVTKFFSTEDFK